MCNQQSKGDLTLFFILFIIVHVINCTGHFFEAHVETFIRVLVSYGEIKYFPSTFLSLCVVCVCFPWLVFPCMHE